MRLGHQFIHVLVPMLPYVALVGTLHRARQNVALATFKVHSDAQHVRQVITTARLAHVMNAHDILRCGSSTRTL